MEALGPGLTGYRMGLEAVETAYRNGLMLAPSGREVTLRPASGDYDRDQAELVIGLIRLRREDIIGITADPQHTRQALSEAQGDLSTAYTWVLDQLDLWDRLEKAYRLLFPDDTTCVVGPDGCSPDAVVRCKPCCGISK
jgi:hypothetical protein